MQTNWSTILKDGPTTYRQLSRNARARAAKAVFEAEEHMQMALACDRLALEMEHVEFRPRDDRPGPDLSAGFAIKTVH